MNLLVFYFIKFSNNDLILLKAYFDDYAIEKFNQKLIIIIIYNKNIFSANNSYPKI